MYNYITIERQYCSGGNEIGRRLAKALNYKIYDHNILVEAAKSLSIPPFYISQLEETSPGSIIFNLSKIAAKESDSSKQIPLADKLFEEEKSIIERVTNYDPCVIVGRCASQILSSREDCLNVFIYANKDFRRQRAIDKEGIYPAQVDSMLKRVDKRRRSFYQTHTGMIWGGEQFDLSLDSGKLGIDTCTHLLTDLVLDSFKKELPKVMFV